MNTNNNTTEKRSYFPPLVEKIELDNEISLALESSPPIGPDEVLNDTTDSFNSNPYQNLV